MRVIVVVGFAAFALSCTVADLTPVIPIDTGALQRFCFMCLQTQSDPLRCAPDMAEACAALMSDLKAPAIRRW